MSANIECMETIQLTEKEKEAVTNRKESFLPEIFFCGHNFFYHSSGHILGSIQMPKLF